MRILILGGGGLGSVLAAYLARAGTDVTLFVKPAQAAALTADGPAPGVATLHVSGLATFSTPVRVTADPAAAGTPDFLIVCVKARDTEAALAPLQGLAVGAVLSLQNGVQKNEVLARFFGRERVLGAITGMGGRLLALGRVEHFLTAPTLVGELDGGPSPRGERLAAAFAAAGLPAACVPDIVRREWHKLAIFLRTAPVCALTGTDIPGALLDPDLLEVCMRVAKEVAAVAAAEGQPLDAMPVWLTPSVTFGSPEAAVRAALGEIAAGLRAQGVPLYPSLAQDTFAGRPTELEATAGDVVRRAARHGIDVPVLATLYRLLRIREPGRQAEG
jgi:2-dehydropantoate 2-reductase